ncbi:MAG: AmmeMemoRadiSam system protein B [Syntrophorhabdales bacterium]
MRVEQREHAKVRWLDIMPTVHNGMEVFVLRDPEGLTEQSLVVSRDVLFLISLMDGTRTIQDIQEACMRASGGTFIHSDRITSVIDTLDAHFLLLNDRYESHLATLREAYEALPCRTAFLAGKSYPDDAANLRAFMNDMILQGQGPAGRDGLKGVIAPHIDYARGMEVYRQTYTSLPEDDNTLFVIFGTCHKFAPRLWNIALRDVVTPFGSIKGAKEVGRLARQDPVLKGYVDEWPHRNEHSIELQLPIIQYLVGHERFEVLSILTGSLHDYLEDGKDPERGEAAELVGTLKEILKAHDGRCVFIAAADMAHIGAQFGDPPPDRSFLDESKQKDGELLEAMARVDAAGFFEAVRKEGDRRRICGFAPIYFLLSMLDSCRGEVVGYQQWTDGASSVSFAGVIFS